MKFTWETHDIDEYLGHVVQTNDGDGEKFILGYVIGSGDGRRAIISLSDGMIVGPVTTAGMVNHLNNLKAIPIFKKQRASEL